jgi:F0F1-type ATP synthase assembly protein I
LAKSSKQSANKLITLQAVIAVMISLVALSWGIKAAYSSLLAGAVCTLANWFFVRRLFRRSMAREAKAIVKDFYLAEILKLGVIALLMLLSMLVFKVSLLPFLLTYVLLQVAVLFAPLTALRTPGVQT